MKSVIASTCEFFQSQCSWSVSYNRKKPSYQGSRETKKTGHPSAALSPPQFNNPTVKVANEKLSVTNCPSCFCEQHYKKMFSCSYSGRKVVRTINVLGIPVIFCIKASLSQPCIHGDPSRECRREAKDSCVLRERVGRSFRVIPPLPVDVRCLCKFEDEHVVSLIIDKFRIWFLLCASRAQLGSRCRCRLQRLLRPSPSIPNGL